MSVLNLIIFVPIVAAVLLGIGAPARKTAMVAAALNLLLGIYVFAGFDSAGPATYQFVSTLPILDSPALSFAVGVDGMALILLLLTVIVTLCAVACTSPAAAERNPALYYASSLLISAGALGAFLSTDLFFFYAFHELALIPTFLMIGIFGKGVAHRAAAWRITIYLGAGSLVLLAGLIALYLNFSGDSLTFDIPTLTANAAAGTVAAGTQEWIFLTLLVGFGILVSLFPFHSWAAPAYAAAPTPTAMLHAGVLKKFGLYGLLRVGLPLLPEGASSPWVQNLLLVLLLGNILFVGLVTIAQKRLDTMLGNSSVMHMGYVFLGIASVSTLGIQGAILLMFAHGISIALLFALAARIEEQTGTLEFAKLGGLAKAAPFLGFAFGLAAFASVGLPGFANFAGEVMIFFGGFSRFSAAGGLSPLEIATICALWGVVISAVYMLRAYRHIFMGVGGTAPGSASGRDIGFFQRWPFLLLMAALLVVGFYPNLFLNLLVPVQAVAAAP
ncbi:NADH-quinone oxidoreductase subunit M [soil metagenome]